MQDRRTTTERRQVTRRRSSNSLVGATHVGAASPLAQRRTDKVANRQLVQFIGARDVIVALGCSRSFAYLHLRRALDDRKATGECFGCRYAPGSVTSRRS